MHVRTMFSLAGLSVHKLVLSATHETKQETCRTINMRTLVEALIRHDGAKAANKQVKQHSQKTL